MDPSKIRIGTVSFFHCLGIETFLRCIWLLYPGFSTLLLYYRLCNLRRILTVGMMRLGLIRVSCFNIWEKICRRVLTGSRTGDPSDIALISGGLLTTVLLV